MADEIKETENKTIETNYLEKIKQLEKEKSEMVSREEYNKAVSDHSKLLDALTKGQTIASKAQENEIKYTQEDINESAKVIQNANCSDLERFKATDKYHKAVLQLKGVDTYLPTGNQLTKNYKGEIVMTDKSAVTPEILERAKVTNEFVEAAASCSDEKELKRFLEDHLI